MICVSNDTLLQGDDIMDKEKYLCDNFFLFKNVPADFLAKLLKRKCVQESKFSQGEIIQNSEHYDSIGIVVKGKAVIKSNVNGVIINKLNKNDIYGVAALFDKPTYSTVVQAVTDCTIITMDKDFVTECISNSPTIALNYIEFLAKKVTFLNKKINAFTEKSSENKLYAYLLQQPRIGNELTLTVDMSTIAKMIGIGRATLYRSFEKLEKSGTITKNDKKIIFNEV